jgi:hypothetical protein
MVIGECLESIQCGSVDLAAILTNASQQSLSRGAEGTVDPAGVSFPRFALPALKDPLQRIIHDSPVGIELRYAPI